MGVSVGVAVGDAVAVGGVVGVGVGSNPGILPEHPDKSISTTEKRIIQVKRVSCSKIILRMKLARHKAPRSYFSTDYQMLSSTPHLLQFCCLITLYFTIVLQFPV